MYEPLLRLLLPPASICAVSAAATQRLRRGSRGARGFRLWGCQLRACEHLCRHDAPVAVIMIIICLFSLAVTTLSSGAINITGLLCLAH